MTQRRLRFLVFMSVAGVLAAVMVGQEKPPVNQEQTLTSGTFRACTGEPGCVTLSVTPEVSFIMGKLKISSKGEITFPEGVTPSEAAKEFASWLKREMGNPCVSAPAKEGKP